MSPKHKSLITFVTGALSALLALTAYAASVPSDVTGVTARLEDGNVVISWNAATDAVGIAYYRIYFSRVSILENDGDYDDFERTAGAETSYVFTKAPYNGKTGYFSVLAVNKSGAESESFASEASVDIPASQDSSEKSSSEISATAQSESSAQPTESSANAQSPLTLQKVEAVSATGVTLAFSASIQANGLSGEHFIITDFSGNVLRIHSVSVAGPEVLIETDPQEPQRPYIVAVLKQLIGIDGSQILGPPPQIAFAGYVGAASDYGRNPILMQPRDTTAPEDATSLTLEPTLQRDGTYTVDAYFEGSINSAHDLSSYTTYTSNDGENFAKTSVEEPSATRVRYQKVPAGSTFGVKVTAKDTTGNESRGVAKVIHLPESGLGLLGVMAIAGAVAGRRMRRKRVIE